jgi:3-deoxy-D-manno-octulosonic-acid transferase
MFPKAVLLSQLSENTQPAIVVVDRIGLLATLYHNVSAAYIGGGFGAGVHSVLEAAFAGIPIACGPRIERSDDALELHAAGSLRILSSAADAATWTEDVTRDSSHAEIAQSVQRYLYSLRGVSRQVFALIEQQQSPAT